MSITFSQAKKLYSDLGKISREFERKDIQLDNTYNPNGDNTAYFSKLHNLQMRYAKKTKPYVDALEKWFDANYKGKKLAKGRIGIFLRDFASNKPLRTESRAYDYKVEFDKLFEKEKAKEQSVKRQLRKTCTKCGQKLPTQKQLSCRAR